MAKKIFVYENDPELLEIVGYILTNSGYEVFKCSSENAVLCKVETYQPDAILLDVVMVDKEGTELCRLLEESPISKHIPIIVFSTNKKVDVLKDVCADDIVQKPFDVNQLLESIANHI